MERKPLSDSEKKYQARINYYKKKWGEIVTEEEVLKKLGIAKSKLKKLREEGVIKYFTIIPSSSNGGVAHSTVIYSLSELVLSFWPKGKVNPRAPIIWDDLISEAEVVAKTGLSKRYLNTLWEKGYLRRLCAIGKSRLYSKTELTNYAIVTDYLEEKNHFGLQSVSELLRIIEHRKKYGY